MAHYDVVVLSEAARLHADINPEPKPSQCGIPPPRGAWSWRDETHRLAQTQPVVPTFGPVRLIFGGTVPTGIKPRVTQEMRDASAAWCRAIRARLGYSSTEMNRRIGISHAQWSAWENGVSVPIAPSRHRIEVYLKMHGIPLPPGPFA